MALALPALFVAPAVLPGSAAGSAPAAVGRLQPATVPQAGGQRAHVADITNADSARTGKPFDPAAEVEYAAHPEEHFQIIEELDNSGHTTSLLQNALVPIAPEPALALDTQKLGQVQLAQPGAPTGNDYEFPDLLVDDAVATRARMVIPDQPIPGVSTRRLLQAGDGAIVSRGATVELTYDMYSWSTGELVESSSLRDGGVLQVTLGSTMRQVPAFVEQSIVGRPAGSRVQVVLARGTDDLPDQLNPADGYVLVVDIASHSPG